MNDDFYKVQIGDIIYYKPSGKFVAILLANNKRYHYGYIGHANSDPMWEIRNDPDNLNYWAKNIFEIF